MGCSQYVSGELDGKVVATCGPFVSRHRNVEYGKVLYAECMK